MRGGIERRDADVGCRQLRRHLGVRHGSGKDDACGAFGRGAGARQLGTLANQHSRDIGPSLIPQLAHCVHQVLSAMPAPECSGEDRERAGRPREAQRSGRSRPEAIGVRTPFDLDDFRSIRVGRQNRGARRHDEIGTRAETFPPSPHRFHEQRPVEQRLARSGVVDDRRIDLQHADRSRRPRRDDPFAAEIVVPLDHRIRPDLACDPRDFPRARPPELPRPQRRSHRNPVHAIGRERAVARAGEDVHVVSERRESRRDRLDMHGAPVVPGTC